MELFSVIPQPLGKTSSPTFTGLTLSGLTETRVLFAGAGGIISDDAGLTYASATDILTAGTYNATDEDDVLQVDGDCVLRTGTVANNNIFLGIGAFNNDDGNTNVGIGFQAGQFNTTTGGGIQNVYIGYRSGRGASVGPPNSGARNIGIGERTLEDNQSGDDNMAIGRTALLQNTTGSVNIAIGTAALQSNTSGLGNLALGSNAMRLSNGSNSVAIGNNSMGTATNANTNIAIGRSSLRYNTTGKDNVVIGADAGVGVSVSSNINKNVFIGKSAGAAILTGGDSNIFIGFNSGINQTTNSDLLIIDNQDRASAAAELTDCLIY